MRLARAGASSTWAELRLGSATGTAIARVNSIDTGGWNSFAETSAPVTAAVSGTHDLFLVFGGGSGFGNVDWIELTAEPLSLEAEAFASAAANPDGTLKVSRGASNIGSTDDGDWIAFSGVDLRARFNRLAIHYASGQPANNTSHRVEVRLGSSTGTLLATLHTPGTEDWNAYSVVEGPITLPSVTATQTVCFVFKGGFGVGNFDWFTFERASP